MKKIVVSSFYNVLINEEEAIPTSTMLEIENFRNNGGVFCVCTNRLYQDVLDYNKDFPFLDYIVSLNGSCTYDVGKEKMIYRNKLSATNIQKIETIFKGYPTTYFTEKQSYERPPKESIYKIEIEIETEEERQKLEKLNVNTSIFYYEEKMYLEITSHKSSMFYGIDQISMQKEIPLKSIIAVCANDSDLSIIQNITKSYIGSRCVKSLNKFSQKKIKGKTDKELEKVLKEL